MKDKYPRFYVSFTFSLSCFSEISIHLYKLVRSGWFTYIRYIRYSKNHSQHIMLSFLLLYSIISWLKVENILSNLILVIFKNKLSSFPTFMLALMFHILFLIHYIININPLFEITWWGGCMSQFLYTQTWQRFNLLLLFLKVYLSISGFYE